MVPGDFAGVCVPGVLEAFPNEVNGGNVVVGQTQSSELVIRNTTSRDLTIAAIQVEALTDTAPSEVSITQAAPILLTADTVTTLNLQMAPSGAGPRSYRIAFRLAESALPPLIVNVTFVGVPITGP
jgi:hypothetical protein